MKVAHFLACAVLAFSVACVDEPTEPPGGNTSGNTMTATVDGLAVNPTTVSAVRASNRIFIVGTGAFRTITLSLVVPTAAGDVVLLPDDISNNALIAEGTPPNNPVWATANAPALANGNPAFSIVTFTTISTTGASGTFSLRAGPSSSGAIGVRFGNGTFNVKF